MNGYEMIGRQKKADALFATLREAKITLEQARLASDEDWEMAAAAARVNPPSPATVKVVLALLERAEKDEERKAEQRWEESQEYGANRCPRRE
jgi:hypothetical protein